MLDISFIRNNQELLKKNIADRNLKGEQFDVDAFLLIDEKRSELTTEVESLRATRNKSSDVSKRPSDAEIEEGKLLKARIKKVEEELAEVDKKWQFHMDWFPNILHFDVPYGKGAQDNVELKAWSPQRGYFAAEELGKENFSEKWMPTFDFDAKDHLTLGTALNIIDVEQSAKVSGSRFAYLKNEAALIQYGLFEFLKKHLLENNFTPMIVPLLVRERALYGSSHFPGDRDQVYEINSEYIEEENNLYLVGSSEPALFSYYMDKTLSHKDLPQKFFAFTPCFRTEVGSWGKDVRGIKRVHQFDKIEMDIICLPEDSDKKQEELMAINEWMFQSLKIPYHVILMCSGDSGYFATARKYDFEGWLPSQKEFIELGSNTNATDYQARRYHTKYTDENGKTQFVHHVNDTGCPIGRTLIAILDNYQRPDGTVEVPEVLQDYVGKDVIG